MATLVRLSGGTGAQSTVVQRWTGILERSL